MFAAWSAHRFHHFLTQPHRRWQRFRIAAENKSKVDVEQFSCTVTDIQHIHACISLFYRQQANGSTKINRTVFGGKKSSVRPRHPPTQFRPFQRWSLQQITWPILTKTNCTVKVHNLYKSIKLNSGKHKIIQLPPLFSRLLQNSARKLDGNLFYSSRAHIGLKGK